MELNGVVCCMLWAWHSKQLIIISVAQTKSQVKASAVACSLFLLSLLLFSLLLLLFLLLMLRLKQTKFITLFTNVERAKKKQNILLFLRTLP